MVASVKKRLLRNDAKLTNVSITNGSLLWALEGNHVVSDVELNLSNISVVQNMEPLLRYLKSRGAHTALRKLSLINGCAATLDDILYAICDNGNQQPHGTIQELELKGFATPSPVALAYFFTTGCPPCLQTVTLELDQYFYQAGSGDGKRMEKYLCIAQALGRAKHIVTLSLSSGYIQHMDVIAHSLCENANLRHLSINLRPPLRHPRGRIQYDPELHMYQAVATMSALSSLALTGVCATLLDKVVLLVNGLHKLQKIKLGIREPVWANAEANVPSSLTRALSTLPTLTLLTAELPTSTSVFGWQAILDAVRLRHDSGVPFHGIVLTRTERSYRNEVLSTFRVTATANATTASMSMSSSCTGTAANNQQSGLHPPHRVHIDNGGSRICRSVLARVFRHVPAIAPHPSIQSMTLQYIQGDYNITSVRCSQFAFDMLPFLGQLEHLYALTVTKSHNPEQDLASYLQQRHHITDLTLIGFQPCEERYLQALVSRNRLLPILLRQHCGQRDNNGDKDSKCSELAPRHEEDTNDNVKEQYQIPPLFAATMQTPRVTKRRILASLLAMSEN